MMRVFGLLGILFLTAVCCQGGDSFLQGRAFYVYSEGQAARVEADGRVSWKSEPPQKDVGDVWAFEGSVLFSDYIGIREVTPEGHELFVYRPEDGREIFACQKLAPSLYLVAECSRARLVEVSTNGVVKSIALNQEGKGGHGFLRGARKTAQGTYLVAHMKEGVKEYNDAGEVIWSYQPEGMSYVALRLANGNTLIAVGENEQAQIVEVTPAKQIAWRLSNEDLKGQLSAYPEQPMKFPTGLFVLPNGNIAFCNWVGHGQLGKGPHIMEVTRGKRVVWSYADHQAFKTVSSIHPLDERGQPLCGKDVH